MKKLIYLLPLVIFVILIGFFIVGLERDPRLIPSPLIGKPAPAFELSPLSQVNTTSEKLTQEDLKGEVTLLNFWATWCPTCRGEHDVLMEIARESNVKIFGVDYKDNQDDAMQWLEKLGNPYRAVAFDPEGKTGIDWGVYGTPETFVMDAEGIIRYKHVGAVSWEVWTKILEPLVKQLQQ